MGEDKESSIIKQMMHASLPPPTTTRTKATTTMMARNRETKAFAFRLAFTPRPRLEIVTHGQSTYTCVRLYGIAWAPALAEKDAGGEIWMVTTDLKCGMDGGKHRVLIIRHE